MDEKTNPGGPTAPVISDAEQRKLRGELTDIGVSLAFRPNSAGIAAEFVGKLRDKVCFDPTVEAAKVTPEGLRIAPSFWSSLTPPQRARLLSHETLEVVFNVAAQAEQLGLTANGEVVPEQKKLHDLYGKATDAVVNEILARDEVGAALPGEIRLANVPSWVKAGSPAYDGDLNISGLYHYLVKYREEDEQDDDPSEGGGGGGGGDEQNPGQGGGEGDDDSEQGSAPAPGQGCTPEGGSPVSETEANSMRESMRQIGTGTALAQALAPKRGRTGWKSLLRQSFEQASSEAEDRTERSYARASRRQLPNVLLPGTIGTEPTLSVCFDVSGSMGETVADIAGECLKLAGEFPEVSVFLTAHTSELVYSGWMKAGGDVGQVKEATGFTGGTDPAPAYEATREVAAKLHGGKFDAMVHFTDCEVGRWPEPPARRFYIGATGPAGEHPRDVSPKPPKGAVVIGIRSGK